MLDEDALEAMLARGRAAKNDDAEMITTDQTDEFEVYERKEPVEPAAAAEPVAPAPVAPSDDDFEVFESKRDEIPIFGEPTPAPQPEAEDFEVYGEPEPAPVAAPVMEEPEPVVERPAARRPEVWPPIGRSHAPAPPAPEPEPAAVPEPAPVTQAANPTDHNHAAMPMHGGGARIAIVQAMFNQELTDMMADLATKRVEKHSGEVVAHIQCPGVYDLPLPVKLMLKRDDVDAVVVLGVVVQGDTKHDEVITHATAKSLQELSLQFEKPVGLGVTGPGMTWGQAEARVVNGAHAVDAVMQLVA